jgi:hypothetical protein
MERNRLNRREVLQLGLITAAFVASSRSTPAVAEVKKVSLSDCLEMGPVEMAKQSKAIMDSWAYLQKEAASIENMAVRKIVLEILDNPAPAFSARLADPAIKSMVRQQLVSQGYLKEEAGDAYLPPAESPQKSPFPFYAASGGGYQSHHAYPGGLATHTALNLKVSLALLEGYRQIDAGLALDRDLVLTSQILHDQLKPWVFQWGPTGESRTEKRLAGAGEHHTLSIAESIFRGLPPEYCVAQACAHQHPGAAKEEGEVLGWIKAAAILLGIDPRERGLLGPSGATLPEPRRIENFVCHLGDHDYVVSVPAAQWMLPIMKRIAVQKYGMNDQDLGGRRFNAFRNYVYSQMTIMNLYHLYTLKGFEALAKTIAGIVEPV